MRGFMPLSQVEVNKLTENGCRNVTSLGNSGTTEFYTGYSGRPEVSKINGNKFLVSQELQNILSWEERDAYTAYRMAQITQQDMSTTVAIVAGIVGGMFAGSAESALNHNPHIDKKAEKHRRKATELDGRENNPSMSRRGFGSWVIGVTGGLATAALTKQSLDKSAAENEVQQVINSPVLASARRKVADWYAQHPQTSPLEDNTRWRNSVVEDPSDTHTQGWPSR